MSFPKVNFLEVVKDATSGNVKTKTRDYLDVGKYAIVDQGQELIGGYSDNENSLCGADLPVIIFGDHTKHLKFIDFPFCLGADGTKVLRPKTDNIDEKYLFYFLQSIQLEDAGYSRHYKFLKEVKIPLPPLPEQKRIAAILDQADALRQKRQQALDQLGQLGQSIFYEMFGENLSEKSHNKQISEIASRVTKGESPKWQGYDYVDQGAHFVTSENVGWGSMTQKPPKFIPLTFHEKKLSRSRLNKGDLLINLVGASIGRACRYSGEFKHANINQAVCVVSTELTESLSSYLLDFILSDIGQRQLLGNRVDGARANISLKNIREFSFYLPKDDELLEYQKIKQRLSTHIQSIDVSILHTETLFASLQQRAFRGEL